MYYTVHYKLHVPASARGQNTIGLLCAGLERPRGSRWPRSRGKKWGRSSPARVLPASKFFVAHSATLMLFNTLVHPQGEPNDERRGDLCLSCTCHPARQILTAKDQVHSSDKSQRRWHARVSAVRFWP